MAHPDITVDYTSGSSADTTTFSAANPIRWIQVYGAGTITLLDNSATPVSRTYTVTGSEVIGGEWTAFTSTTCSRVRATSQAAMPPTIPFPATNAVVPANQLQSWLDAGTVVTTGFVPAMQTLTPFNFQLTGNISFPKITAALNGQGIALANLGTGATAVTLVPSGTDSMGVVAAGVTAATAASPASQKAQRYIANVTTGQWVPGI